jgi:general secretion pathway protein H
VARRWRCAEGFTLIEILVVVLVIAITAGIAVIAYDSDDRIVVAHEAKRFGGAIEHASARAQWRAETLGVSADGNGWRFWRRPVDASGWLPIVDDDVLSAHAAPAGIVVSPLSFAGQPLPLDAIVPLRASGHNEPFAFLLRGKAARIVLSADPLNRVSLVGDTASPEP